MISILKGLEHVEARIRSMQEKYEASAKELTHTDQGAMYVVMGHALSAWARMEEGLVVLVELFLLSPGSDKAGLIMYSIVNFNVWLTIINDLYAQEPRFEAFKPRWNKISARIRRIKISETDWPTSQLISRKACLAGLLCDHRDLMSGQKTKSTHLLPSRRL